MKPVSYFILLALTVSAHFQIYAQEKEMSKSLESFTQMGWSEHDKHLIDSMANTMDRINSLIIVKNDTMVYESYFNGFDPNTDYSNIKSGSKSILNILVGIAVQEGYIKSIDQTVYDFLPEYFKEEMDPRKKQISIRHLMTMQSGLEPTSLDKYSAWVSSEDWVAYALELPLEEDPGTLYGYSTGDTHLLGVVLAKAVGTSALEFAQKHLFSPMDIHVDQWTADPMGYHEGGNNIFIKPADYAKIGVMIKHGGKYLDKQIINKEWLDDSVNFKVTPQGISRPFPIDGYGYLWWLIEASGYKTYCGIGFGGQYMMTIPELDMIIVLTSKYRGSAPSQHFTDIATLINEFILAPYTK
ncbi:beta-lactamase family protein [Belliella sp. DSM 111904]|uniref:Beta-lactamase family protein n=1 Tax=Belliella filtrata TaxID=2923435 RepID=A0ABS9UX29_9BACT|nr:serine hydrolase [Belliella filtrata]MCH7408736.1 beta-lactamase family protein [Belliella filtrata]